MDISIDSISTIKVENILMRWKKMQNYSKKN